MVTVVNRSHAITVLVTILTTFSAGSVARPDPAAKTLTMLNPYDGVDWKSVIKVPSATHLHMKEQSALDHGYRSGLRHFPISNYYPSAPYIATTRLSDFKLHQTWPVKRNGVTIEPPINWNKLITWRDELKEPFRSSLPFTETELVFPHIPDDVILSNNAEHHGFTNGNPRCHICAPGSSFSSGTFDVKGRNYRLPEHGIPIGFGGTWQQAFTEMLKLLDYPDGGGIIIAHPAWLSGLSDQQVFEMLDFDQRVLGIEIYNHGEQIRDWTKKPADELPPEPEPGFALKLWDRILSTGRRCWGFCVPDHGVEKGGDWQGRSVLLVSRFSERHCLRAYRNGNFYGCLKDNGLTVTDFQATKTEVKLQTNQTAKITFITNKGIAKSVTGTSATYAIPTNDGKPDVVYVRVEISDESGERLFLQPVMYHH